MQNPLGFTKLESVASPRGEWLYFHHLIFICLHIGEKVFQGLYNAWAGSKTNINNPGGH